MSGFYAEVTYPTDDRGGTATMMTNNPKAWFLRRTEFPQPGDRLRFLDRNGYSHEREAALKVMSPGDVFTVASCRVDNWEHSVRFEEIDGAWNGVMFEQVAVEDMRDDCPRIVAWVPEDELPESLPREAYDALYPYSRVDIIRWFPVFAPTSP